MDPNDLFTTRNTTNISGLKKLKAADLRQLEGPTIVNVGVEPTAVLVPYSIYMEAVRQIKEVLVQPHWRDKL